MAGTKSQLESAAEAFFAELRRVRASGGATGERSAYAPLKPRVFCVGELADQGAGHPDFGLYTAKQAQRGKPRPGQAPERGVVEVKSARDDAWVTADGDQVSRYWGRYRLVLVTNTRDFVLVGAGADGRPARLETFRLAASAEEFEARLERPRAFAREAGAALGEYLARALSHRAALAEPRDLAWLLASYARDGLARVEAAGDAPALAAVRTALEEALGAGGRDAPGRSNSGRTGRAGRPRFRGANDIRQAAHSPIKRLFGRRQKRTMVRPRPCVTAPATHGTARPARDRRTSLSPGAGV